MHFQEREEATMASCCQLACQTLQLSPYRQKIIDTIWIGRTFSGWYPADHPGLPYGKKYLTQKKLGTNIWPRDPSKILNPD
jgi:hypothetical protein